MHTLICFRPRFTARHRCRPTAFSASTADDNNILRRASSYLLCDLPGHRSEIRVTGQAVRALIGAQPARPATSHNDATLTIHLPVPNSAHTSSHHAEESLSSGVLGASRRAIPIIVSSHPASLEVNHHPVSSQNVAGGSSMPGVIDTSTMANPIPVPTRKGSVAPRHKERAFSSPPLCPGRAHIGDLHSPADTV
jgi:hypothetical protein